MARDNDRMFDSQNGSGQRKPKSRTDAVQNRGRQGLRTISGPQGFIRQEEAPSGKAVDLSKLQRTQAPSLEQFQRRQGLRSAQDRHALEREAFGQARGLGRAETAVRQSLRSPDRMDNVLRENAMSEEQRQSESNLIAGAAQSDAEALREARGLRQEGDIANRELAFRERDSVRDFQASLADTQARTDIAGARAQQKRQAQAFNTAKTVMESVVGNEEELPGAEGQLRFFMSETQKEQLNNNAPWLRDEDIGALAGFAHLLPQLGTRKLSTLGFKTTPGQPVSAGPVLELIERAAQNPGASTIQMGRGDIAVSDLEGFAGGAFNQLVERARSGFERQVAERVLQGGDLDEKQQKFVENDLRNTKERLSRELTQANTGNLARSGLQGRRQDGITSSSSIETIPDTVIRDLTDLGVEVEDGESISDVRKKIDSLSADEYQGIVARRVLGRQGA